VKAPTSRIRRLGFLLAWFSVVSLALRADVTPNEQASTVAQEAFDRYGNVAWEDEKARLDNFAIQLLQEPGYVGSIFVFNAPSMCRGEAQARAVRAKRYIVEHRGVPWNRVIWREEGYRKELVTTLWIVKPDQPIEYHALTYGPSQRETYATRNCKARLAQIKRSKW
jgi:hypothetical protein